MKNVSAKIKTAAKLILAKRNKNKLQPIPQKIAENCIGNDCGAHQLCRAGHRIVDARVKDICSLMRQRFAVDTIKVDTTAVEAAISEMIKETNLS